MEFRFFHREYIFILTWYRGEVRTKQDVARNNKNGDIPGYRSAQKDPLRSGYHGSALDYREIRES